MTDGLAPFRERSPDAERPLANFGQPPDTSDEPTFDWTGGARYTIVRQQYQLLYELYGPFATELAEDAILWIDEKRPTSYQYWDWGREVDLGKAQIAEEVRSAFTVRLNHYLRTEGTKTYRALSRMAAQIANAVTRLVKDGEATGNYDLERINALKSLSAHLQHAGTGATFHFKELMATSRPKEPNTFITGQNVRIVTNGGKAEKKLGPSARRQLRALKQPAVVGEFREVE